METKSVITLCRILTFMIIDDQTIVLIHAVDMTRLPTERHSLRQLHPFLGFRCHRHNGKFSELEGVSSMRELNVPIFCSL